MDKDKMNNNLKSQLIKFSNETSLRNIECDNLDNYSVLLSIYKIIKLFNYRPSFDEHI